MQYTLITSVYPPTQSVNYPVLAMLTLLYLCWRMWQIARR